MTSGSASAHPPQLASAPRGSGLTAKQIEPATLEISRLPFNMPWGWLGLLGISTFALVVLWATIRGIRLFPIEVSGATIRWLVSACSASMAVSVAVILAKLSGRTDRIVIVNRERVQVWPFACSKPVDFKISNVEQLIVTKQEGRTKSLMFVLVSPRPVYVNLGAATDAEVDWVASVVSSATGLKVNVLE